MPNKRTKMTRSGRTSLPKQRGAGQGVEVGGRCQLREKGCLQNVAEQTPRDAEPDWTAINFISVRYITSFTEKERETKEEEGRAK